MDCSHSPGAIIVVVSIDSYLTEYKTYSMYNIYINYINVYEKERRNKNTKIKRKKVYTHFPDSEST